MKMFYLAVVALAAAVVPSYAVEYTYVASATGTSLGITIRNPDSAWRRVRGNVANIYCQNVCSVQILNAGSTSSNEVTPVAINAAATARVRFFAPTTSTGGTVIAQPITNAAGDLPAIPLGDRYLTQRQEQFTILVTMASSGSIVISAQVSEE